MRALPEILKVRPDAVVVIVGGDGVSYGSRPRGGQTWRDTLMAEVGCLPDRVYFTGRLPYARYVRLLQISSVHLYLTYPFVLSWSMLEAMAAGALVVGSRTQPVEEVVEDGANGRLVDFFDYAEIACVTAKLLKDREHLAEMRAAGRATVLKRFELSDCLCRQRALIDHIVSSR